LARMSKSRRNTSFLPLDDALFGVKPRKPVPHEFVLDAKGHTNYVLIAAARPDYFRFAYDSFEMQN
jgi:hypothetical protein